MSYALLDDGYPGHPKIVPLSDAAFRVHTTALCHVRRYRTGGFIAQGSEEKVRPRNGDCPKCFSMPSRVEGARCPVCRLEAEAPPRATDFTGGGSALGRAL